MTDTSHANTGERDTPPPVDSRELTQLGATTYGSKAIVADDEVLGAQIGSFLAFGLGFGAIVGAVLFGCMLLALAFVPHVDPMARYLFLVGAFVVGILYSLLAGAHVNKPLYNGVPELFGSYVSWWLAPPGLSWWIPEPFGSITQTVFVGDNPATRNLVEVEAADNVQMSTRYTFVVRVLYPFVYARYGDEGSEKALRALMDRTMRWLISIHLSTHLPAARGEVSEVMAGASDTIRVVGEDGTERMYTFSSSSVAGNRRTLARMARDLGWEIVEFLAEDFTLPKSVADAAERKRIEEEERAAELAEADTVVAIAKRLAGLSDEQPLDLSILAHAAALEAAQAERGKIDKVVVTGGAGDFTQGAAVQTSRTRTT